MSKIIERQVKTSKHKMKVMMEQYNSAFDVSEDCKERKITSSKFTDKSKDTFDEWEGVKSYDEALSLLKNGYQPTVEALKSKIKFNKTGAGKRISFQNNITGAVPVVPLAMMGVPNNMIDMKMKPIKCKVLDIYYDVTVSCGTPSEKIIENGQKLLGTIVELEKQGYKFNLYGIQTYSDSSSVDILMVKIKSSNQPLDLKRISFPLTHAAFFRVIGFDWYSRTPKGTYRGGYGCALSYTLSDKSEREDFVKQVFGQNAIYIAGKEILYKDEEHIKEVLLTNEKR